jgi:hypothetical protein
MRINPNKTVSAQADGIIISYRESNKYQFMAYQDGHAEQKPVKKYQQITKPVFNRMQQKIYAKTVYGLNAYTHEQIVAMPKLKRQMIISKHSKVQQVLNQWKQELAAAKVDSLLAFLFPKSKITKVFSSVNGYEKQMMDRHSFKELGLDQQTIAKKLLDEKLLQQDFFNISIN